jgi:hypothetical protein
MEGVKAAIVKEIATQAGGGGAGGREWQCSVATTLSTLAAKGG